MRRFVVVVLSLAWSGGFAAPAPVKMLFFGDSITAGQFVEPFER